MTKIDVLTIDTGIPIPEQRFTHVPIAELKVGESVLFPLDKRPSVQSKASKLKKETGKEFTIKKQDNNYARVWRTK